MSFNWTVDPGVLAALVNGRLRVTFPVAILETPALKNPNNYEITLIPAGAEPVSVYEVNVINDQTIDLFISGRFKVGVYNVTIAEAAAREFEDGVANPELVLEFAGVDSQYHATSDSTISQQQQQLSLMGAGLSFPLRIASNGEFARVSEEENVDECLIQLLKTEKGERPFTVRDGVLFGTELRRTLFENGTRAQARAFMTVNEAIAIWEPRVQLLEVRVVEEDSGAGGSLIRVTVKYLVIASGNIRNLVFPFSLPQ